MVSCAAMISQFRKSIALAMFVIFMANVVVSGFHTAWVAHEIEHDKARAQLTVPGDHFAAHDYLADASAGDDDQGALSTTEHQLLHAADHLQLLPATIASSILPLPHGLNFPIARSSAAPFTASESPFRPPRRIASLG